MNYTPLNYALWLLGRQDRSIGEIRHKMKEKKFESDEIEKTISFLKNNKFLDDTKFAKHFVANQLSIKPFGRYQLKIRLQRKLISEEITEKVLNEINLDEKKLVEIAFLKWIRVNKNKNNKYDKVCRHLLGRGFEWENIKSVVEEHKSKLVN